MTVHQMPAKEAIAAVRKMTDVAELERIAKEDGRSTVRKAAVLHIRFLQQPPGRPLTSPEEGRLVQRSVWLSENLWQRIHEYGERNGLLQGSAIRTLIREGLKHLAGRPGPD